MAFSQEMAGKEKRFSYIDENYDAFVQKYKELLDNIEKVLCHYQLLPEMQEEEKPILEEKIMSGILANIRSRIDEFDFAEIFELLEQIEKYEMNEKQAEFFDKLKILMNDLNVEEIQQLLDSYE